MHELGSAVTYVVDLVLNVNVADLLGESLAGYGYTSCLQRRTSK